MYGLTRATATLLGAAAAGFLLWLAVQVAEPTGDETGSRLSAGEYWAAVGLVAAAGFVMALSQLLGGWTKWGWPRISGQVLLIAFFPVLVVTLWIVLADQPADDEWLQGNILDWSDDIGLEGLVDDLRAVTPLLVLGTGLVFGFSFDTSGPRVVTEEPEAEEEVRVPQEGTDARVVGAGAVPEEPQERPREQRTPE